MKTTNKLTYILVSCFILSGLLSCKKYIDDAFANPNKPVVVDPDAVLPSVISNYARGLMFDARGVGNYASYWHRTASGDNWDRMGYTPGSDFGGEKWRSHYWSLGVNLLNIIRDGRNTNRPAYAGAGYALFALSWTQLTDYHGEVILDEAFKSEQLTFKYNTQDKVYEYALKQCDSAIFYFNQATAGSSFSTGDRYFYNGDIDKWKKFTYGVKALIYHRYFNKSTYAADSVIKYVNLSFGSAADDALIKFDASLATISTAALNFYGPVRANLGGYRPSKYLIDLMKGAGFFTGVTDPRLAYIFKPATDGQFRGLPANNGFTGFTSTTQPWNFWGFNVTTAPTGGIDTAARTYFKNAAPFPILTYSMLQFTKAEAALKKGDLGTAKTAYEEGIRGSMSHLTTYYTGYTPITETAKNNFISSTTINPATVTLNHIMLQKFVSLWPYGMEETWVDMRRYNYDTVVYKGYTPVASLYPDNGGKLAYRVRPRYNSEYIWNVNELQAIGALNFDYHTQPVWFTKP
ncbi:MAG: SusD/RagB family nutrient-binding outer membrane lipoprotein [Flavihumibacter sp.]|nr:SusD/RagB family nutrient-binding outer membrane lipoprotein [Flavihumibacter sp.]